MLNESNQINHQKTTKSQQFEMPLIIVTGFPSSGKTKRSNELADFFRKREKTVHVVCENSAIPKAGFTKNEYFADSQKEKIVRSHLKSETQRLLTKDNVVILDAGNYIKGKNRLLPPLQNCTTPHEKKRAFFRMKSRLTSNYFVHISRISL